MYIFCLRKCFGDCCSNISFTQALPCMIQVWTPWPTTSRSCTLFVTRTGTQRLSLTGNSNWSAPSSTVATSAMTSRSRYDWAFVVCRIHTTGVQAVPWPPVLYLTLATKYTLFLFFLFLTIPRWMSYTPSIPWSMPTTPWCSQTSSTLCITPLWTCPVTTWSTLTRPQVLRHVKCPAPKTTSSCPLHPTSLQT